MKNELIIKTKQMVDTVEMMKYPDISLERLRYETLRMIMNEIRKNGMDLLDQRVIDNPGLNGQVYETNLVIMKTSEYQRLKEIEEEYMKSLKVWKEV